MRIICPTFTHEGNIPKKYTCDGDNINPPLHISDIPSAAKSLALVVEDPDSPHGTFTHWVVYDIPVGIEAIHENTRPGTDGVNDFKEAAYGGPCPGSGRHRYYFKLYGLDSQLDLQPGRSREELEQAMKGHVIATAEVMGKYSRDGS